MYMLLTMHRLVQPGGVMSMPFKAATRAIAKERNMTAGVCMIEE
jgi:hypothetical protein